MSRKQRGWNSLLGAPTKKRRSQLHCHNTKILINLLSNLKNKECAPHSLTADSHKFPSIIARNHVLVYIVDDSRAPGAVSTQANFRPCPTQRRPPGQRGSITNLIHDDYLQRCTKGALVASFLCCNHTYCSWPTCCVALTVKLYDSHTLECVLYLHSLLLFILMIYCLIVGHFPVRKLDDNFGRRHKEFFWRPSCL